MSKELKIGDLVSCYGAQGYSYGVVTQTGREYPDNGRYRSQFADIKWSDIEKPCRIYKCYRTWDVVDLVVEAIPYGKA